MARNTIERFDPLVEELIDSGAEIVFNFGSPASGKTCFLMTLYQYLRVNNNKWNMDNNPIGNFDSIIRVREHIKNAIDSGTLPRATTTGVIHELDVLISPIEFKNRSKLFVFLDMSGEDMTSFLKSGTLETRNKKFLIKELNTNFLYFVPYDKPSKADLDLPVLLNYINYDKKLDLQRFAIIVSHWDKNYNAAGMKFEKLSPFLKSKMPETWKKMRALSNDGVDVNAFKFSIGNVEGSQLMGGFNLEFCEKVVVWLYSQYFEEDESEPQKKFWRKFIENYKNLG